MVGGGGGERKKGDYYFNYTTVMKLNKVSDNSFKKWMIMIHIISFTWDFL